MENGRVVSRQAEVKRLKAARRHIDYAGGLVWATAVDYREAGVGPYEALEAIARALAEILDILDEALEEV
jgi:hypothetical protein